MNVRYLVIYSEQDQFFSDTLVIITMYCIPRGSSLIQKAYEISNKFFEQLKLKCTRFSMSELPLDTFIQEGAKILKFSSQNCKNVHKDLELPPKWRMRSEAQIPTNPKG